jgi:hypothetical protein
VPISIEAAPDARELLEVTEDRVCARSWAGSSQIKEGTKSRAVADDPRRDRNPLERVDDFTLESVDEFIGIQTPFPTEAGQNLCVRG